MSHITEQSILEELNRRLDPSRRIEAGAVERSERYGTPVMLEHVPQITCADGFRMSVQASGYHYCSPRDSVGPWREVEIGFPSKKVEDFMPYIDGDEDTDPTDTVYGYVPIDLVVKAIAKHGGFAADTGGAS